MRECAGLVGVDLTCLVWNVQSAGEDEIGVGTVEDWRLKVRVIRRCWHWWGCCVDSCRLDVFALLVEMPHVRCHRFYEMALDVGSCETRPRKEGAVAHGLEKSGFCGTKTTSM